MNTPIPTEIKPTRRSRGYEEPIEPRRSHDCATYHSDEIKLEDFDCGLDSVRDQVVAKMKAGHLFMSSDIAEWAEKHVTALSDFENFQDKQYAYDILEWYIQQSWCDVLIRAINFALKWQNTNNDFKRKMLQCLRKKFAGTSGIALEAFEGLREFLNEVLKGDSHIYSDWESRQAGIEMVVMLREKSFIDLIQGQITLFKSFSTQDESVIDELELAGKLGFMKKAVELLQ